MDSFRFASNTSGDAQRSFGSDCLSDIAGTAYRPAIAALTSLVPTTQILFGSDNPFVPLAETAEGIMQLGFSADDLERIDRNNALTLLPRLKAS